MTDSAPDGTQILPAGAPPRSPEARSQQSLEPGRSLGPYEIVAPLGAGGMGQVYRAHDPRLGREVAIKVLVAELAGDEENRRRLEREARAAAALNHPNVLAIYDVGVCDGAPFLVSELLAGESLREVLDRGPLPLARALDFAGQTLAGLASAHARGIVHRDLKPANLFVSTDGRVKILDFGLAKPLMPSVEGSASEAATLTELTGHGRLLGTVGYMAPEQVLGERAGTGADVFAFGCVLYEMLTARRAFTRSTAVETLSAILKEEPPPASSVAGGLDPELDHLLARCLAKRPEDRFRSASEALAALEAVGGRVGRGSRDGAPPAATTSSRRRIALLAAVTMAAVAIGVAATALLTRTDRAARPAPPETWEQVTFFADAAVSPALSRDGRMLAFLRGPSTFFGPAEVYVKLLPHGEPAALTDDGQRRMGPVFSPDGSRIAYTQRDAAGAWDTWVVPVLGGAPQPWLLNASGLTWIDRDRILFSEVAEGIHMGLVEARESRAEPRRIYLPPGPRGMAHRSALSPDGRWILTAEMDTGEWLRCRLLPRDGTSAGRPVGPDGQCTHAEWSPDGRWMYVTSNASGRFQLWRQRFPDGEPAPLTSGPLEVEGLAITPDGRFALASVGGRQSSVTVVDAGRERPIGEEGYVFLDANSHFGFSRPFSPDGRKLFYQRRQAAHRSTPSGGEFTGELWSVDLPSGQKERLLAGLEVYGYDVAGDGSRLVAGVIAADGSLEVWLVPLDRRHAPQRLVLGAAASPWLGPAGEVFFRGSLPGGADRVFVSAPAGAAPQPVDATPIQELCGVSPDGEWLIVLLPVSEGRAFGQLAALPRGGGAPRPICANCYLSWVPGGKQVYIFLYAADHRGVEDVRTVLIDLPEGASLPDFPPGGVESHQDLTALAGVRWTKDGRVHPGPRPDLYAYAIETVQRNIFRIPLPGA